MKNTGTMGEVNRKCAPGNDTTFVNNSASTQGGALALEGVDSHPNTFPAAIASCSFVANSGAAKGGALAVSYSHFSLSLSSFEEN